MSTNVFLLMSSSFLVMACAASANVLLISLVPRPKDEFRAFFLYILIHDKTKLLFHRANRKWFARALKTLAFLDFLFPFFAAYLKSAFRLQSHKSAYMSNFLFISSTTTRYTLFTIFFNLKYITF